MSRNGEKNQWPNIVENGNEHQDESNKALKQPMYVSFPNCQQFWNYFF